MKNEAPRSRRPSAIDEYRRVAGGGKQGLSWWMLFSPEVLFTLGPLIIGGIGLLSSGKYLWGSLALGFAIALPLYAVLLARGESDLLRRMAERRARREARALERRGQQGR